MYEIKLMVGGSRHIEDYHFVAAKLQGIAHKLYMQSEFTDINQIRLISGGALGVDKIAEEWYACMWLGDVPYIIKPEWVKDGKLDPTAGFKRNQLIVDEATHAVLFFSEKHQCKGTHDALQRVIKKGIPFWVFTKTYPQTQKELF